jgi:periplasmic divalent cation tolerance protein
MEFCIVQTTIDTEDGARAIARAALDARLAACAQIVPIRSLYTWKGELRDEAELLVQLKARVADYEALHQAIRAAHTYEVPEILRIDIASGHAPYLDWIASSTARGQAGSGS